MTGKALLAGTIGGGWVMVASNPVSMLNALTAFLLALVSFLAVLPPVIRGVIAVINTLRDWFSGGGGPSINPSMALGAIVFASLVAFATGCASRELTLADGTRYRSDLLFTNSQVAGLTVSKPDGTRLELKGASSDTGAALDVASKLLDHIPK